jgi:UDP-4-amino-4,6-dideoxy-N-acetyl-beta-L-altrosamine N-acetyltransferase
MIVKKNIKYKCGNLEFTNYLDLSKQELLVILEFRNHIDVRKMMNNTGEISISDHFSFIEKLKQDGDNFYWIVRKNENIIGAIYLNKIDHENKSAFWGIFLNPKYIGTGIGLEIEFECMRLFFDEFQLNIIKGEVIQNNKDSHSIQAKFNFKEVFSANNGSCTLYELSRINWSKLPNTYKEFKYLLK